MASALDFGHRRGVVHRDVKPANILIDTETSQVLLSDFGIAWQIGGNDGLTAAGSFIGTFDYSSPEQISGDDLDGRSDQYALACMAVQLLTGCKPFTGPTAASVIKRHLVDPRPRWRRCVPKAAAGSRCRVHPVSGQEARRSLCLVRGVRRRAGGQLRAPAPVGLHPPMRPPDRSAPATPPGSPLRRTTNSSVRQRISRTPSPRSRIRGHCAPIRATRDLPQHRVAAGDQAAGPSHRQISLIRRGSAMRRGWSVGAGT